MTGHSLKAMIEEGGYFHIWLATTKRDAFFQDDLEKLFFLAQLEGMLATQTTGQGSRVAPPLPSLELLAYSLTKNGVHLLVHTKRKRLMEYLGRTLIMRFTEYLTQRPGRSAAPFDALFITDHLTGAHAALNVSREIHLLHAEWRQARFSSIGFYLDDRHSDWLCPGRLTSLFQNDPRCYLRLLRSRRTESDRIFEFIET